ncbi:MAG: BlaI/MecI/CopY family transcriptional regulator [Saprospiraceae bacterium]
MKKLTKAEEEIMQVLWRLNEAAVGDIRDGLSGGDADNKPAHSTISTMMKILVEKGFVHYKAFGRTFVYRPAISKADYGRQSVKTLLQNYFGGSANRLVSFLVKEEDLSVEELNELLDKLDDADKEKNKL